MLAFVRLKKMNNDMKISLSYLARWTVIASLSTLLCGCFIKPYQFDLYQGNDIPLERVGQIQPGMAQEEVRYLLGTPLLNDVFETERWDYIYFEKPGNGEETRCHLAIFFERGRVARVTHDALSDEPLA